MPPAWTARASFSAVVSALRGRTAAVRQAEQDVRQAARVPDDVPLTPEQRRLVREALAARRRAARLLERSRRRKV